MLLTQKTNKRGRRVGKPVLSGYEFTFDTTMNSASTDNSANYRVQTYVQVRVKVRKKFVKKLQPQPIGFTVNYLPSSDAVKLLTGKQAFKYGGQITLVAAPPSGISSAAGGFLDGNYTGTGGDNAVYNISAGGRSITLA